MSGSSHSRGGVHVANVSTARGEVGSIKRVTQSETSNDGTKGQMVLFLSVMVWMTWLRRDGIASFTTCTETDAYPRTRALCIRLVPDEGALKVKAAPLLRNRG
jgi:hypothetical protein